MTKDSTKSISFQYLFFILNGETFALETSDVKEIVDLSTIRKVPNSNSCIRGVTNIRGELIPVVDLKKRLNTGKVKKNRRISLIIVSVKDLEDNKKVPIAIMVDSVEEVEDIYDVDILEKPAFGTKVQEKYVKNMLRVNDEFITLFDIDALLNIEELSKIE